MLTPPEYQRGFCIYSRKAESVPRYKNDHKIPSWLSANADCKEGRFIQVGNSLLLSKKFQKISQGARLLYFAMAMESAGKIEFVFPLKQATKHGFKEMSFRRYIKELTDSGFITVTSGANTREPNIYKFSFEWKKEPPK